MIEVFIVKDGEPLGHIEIERGKQNFAELNGADYSEYTIRFEVDRGSAVGIHSRTIYGFPRNKLNVFALVRQALNTLDHKELELEPGYDPDSPEASVPQDLARQIRGAVREIQAGFGRLHRH